MRRRCRRAAQEVIQRHSQPRVRSGAVEHGVEAEELATVLGRTTDTSDEFRRVISGALGASATGSRAVEAMSVGRLAKTDWKVEFVTSSSRCKALRAPLVQMVFHVADGYGGVRVQPVEMSVAEFEVRSRLRGV